MKTNYIIGIGLFFAILCFSACDESNFEQVVEIDIPPHESRLAVNAIFLSRQDSLDILVSNSLGILDNSDFSDIDDASVRLTRSDAPVGAFSYDTESGLYISKLSEPLGNEPVDYKLEVENGAYPMASATQKMPESPVIVKIEADDNGGLDDGGTRVDQISVEIRDIAGVKQYYGMRAFVTGRVEIAPGDTLDYSYRTFLYSNNPLTFNANRSDLGLLISDGSFDGTNYTLTAFTYDQLPFNQLDTKLEVELISLSEATYQYTRSLAQYNDSVGNPFAEPVTVFSNIENGYGIFGLGSVVSESISLE